MSVSGDGKYIAIGSWGYGKVYTYGWDGSSWVQRSSAIQPSMQQNDYFGYSVELNSDGSVLVVGSWTDKVYVYNWNGSEWVLRGDPIIEGELPEAYPNGFNKKVSINADGSIISTYNNIATSKNSGGTTIQVYKWDGVKWKKIGENTSISATGNKGGLALSDDGLTFVVGEPEYLNSDGRARVLKTTLLDNVGDTDSDSDGIIDSDDFCPSTSDGLVGYGRRISNGSGIYKTVDGGLNWTIENINDNIYNHILSLLKYWLCRKKWSII